MNWFEYFQTDLSGQYKEIVKALRAKRTVAKDSGLARLNSGKITAVGNSHGLALRIHDRSSKGNPAYVGLEGMPQDNSNADFLANLARICEAIRIVAEIDEQDKKP